MTHAVPLAIPDMPFPAFAGRVNRHLTNPLIGRFAGSAGSLGLLEHRGRKTGKSYRTPVMAFRAPEGFAIVLTYGERVDWLRNIQAAGEAVLIWRHRRFALSHPEIVPGTPGGVRIPRWARLILFLVRAKSTLVMHARETGSPGEAR